MIIMGGLVALMYLTWELVLWDEAHLETRTSSHNATHPALKNNNPFKGANNGHRSYW